MKKRSSLKIMLDLMILAKVHTRDLVTATLAGVISFFSSTGIAVLAALLIVSVGGFIDVPFSKIIMWMAVLAFIRGITRYLEQYMNHLVAFRVLSTLRDKVFSAVRKLAPAKIEGSNKGSLISMITSDIELIEVFYAHTISPISIAIICGITYIVLIALYSPAIALVTLISYLIMGVGLPILFSKWSKNIGRILRRKIGGLNNIFLDLLRGITEIMQFAYRKRAIRVIEKTNKSLVEHQAVLIEQLALLLALEDVIVVLTICAVILIGIWTGLAPAILLPLTFGIFFSFPAIANVASLGNGLSQSLSCGERVLNLLEEKPVADEVTNGIELNLELATDPLIVVNDLSFSYGDRLVLENFNLKVAQGEFLGIRGESGCGKSTLLKLMMYFWPLETGEILISGHSVQKINTQSLWHNISYMTQHTEFFEGTIRDNLLIAKQNSTEAEMRDALDKAAILDFVDNLEHGLDTTLAELGDNFSAGERQRFGLARCFLKDTKILLLDEPTSNLDTLNENIILDALKCNSDGKTVILVSHRESCFKTCDRVIDM
ncbi:MAG: ABC transporter ATP-binding protein [Clostridiaceae bacterium]|jgi:ATP-binding cassette subfamily C protein|nr:ABC transporter ATP-binding protein [Clostridia bacterium]MBP6949865.1 ABC transporter ATP-binding protein [Clostridia bacterium]NMA35949.1 ABC transporter ATP-binding protein [Clostridiaceae bacterium]